MITRVLWLAADGATILREDAATGPDALGHVASAALARAVDEGRVLCVQGDRDLTFLVSGIQAVR